MQNVKKSLSIKILASFTLLFLLISIFANFIERKNKIQSVSAANDDSVFVTYTFDGADMYYFDTYVFNYQWDGLYSVIFRTTIHNNPDGTTTFIPNFKVVNVSGKNIVYDNYYLYDYTHRIDSANVSQNSTTKYFFSLTDDRFINYGGYFPMMVHVADLPFNSNIYKVRLYTSDYFYDGNETNFNGKMLYIEYFDINEASISFGFYVPSNYEFVSRTYYFNNPTALDDNHSYNEGYSAGYTDGNSVGNSSGYKDGYKAGETIGYHNGYTKGVENGGKYTFANLLGAVVDVPVRSFTSLFNFELLGVNLAGFFSGLLTLAVILTIVKLIKGG